MTGDESFPEPGPVAEYRDPELARRFKQESVPQHGAGFWTELETRLSAPGTDGVTVERAVSVQPVDGADETELQPAPIELGSAANGAGRWGAGRWLGVAAASLVLLGIGGAVVIGQTGSSSPVSSAAPSVEGDPDPDDDESVASAAADPSPSSTSTAVSRPTTTTKPLTTTTRPAPDGDGAVVDYFDGEVRVDSIGPGTAVGFSPDGSAVLVVDDAPGVASGCEGAELLSLFAQDLATGQREPAMGQDGFIETGGLELMIDPFGTTPEEVGTRPVYGREWCDGEPSALWQAVLSSDGQLSMSEEVAIGGQEDPFARPPGSADGLSAVSPDGDFVASTAGSGVEVVGLVDGGEDQFIAAVPELLLGERVSAVEWSPDGEAIAISTSDSLLLWSPWTGASQRFDREASGDLMFDRSGSHLALGGGGTVMMLIFGDGPEATPAPPRCSGRIDVSPLTTDVLRSQHGLPIEVASTVVAIDRAAAVCDWEALDALTVDGFVSTLDSDEPAASWQLEEEENGGSPMWYLRTLFRQPHIVEIAESQVSHLWPAIDQDDDCRLDEAERASVVALGLDPALAEEACVVVGGYAGYRTTIDDDGVWRSFLTGG